MNHEVKIYEQAEIDYMDGLKYKEIAENFNMRKYIFMTKNDYTC